jgi:diacylglycerol kinase (ATP)
MARLYKAMHYSLAGLRSTYQHERAFREEAWLLIVLVPLAFWLGDNHIEYILLIGSWIIVMIAELFNTAIEATIDRIGADTHELSGRAKDVGSAAVMVSLILALAIWITVIIG